MVEVEEMKERVVQMRDQELMLVVGYQVEMRLVDELVLVEEYHHHHYPLQNRALQQELVGQTLVSVQLQ